MSKSKIEWTDETWNPVTGCTKVSDGCKHCYVERIWPRLAGNPKHVCFGRKFTDVQCHPERLEQPIHWKKPRMVFVNSMSDLFHEDVPDEFILDAFDVMRQCTYAGGGVTPDHTFQILTKRAERMAEFCNRLKWNGETLTLDGEGQSFLQLNRDIWIGVSVEDQATADERIPLLLQTPAAVRFVSFEPLLEAIRLETASYGWLTGWETEIEAVSDGRGGVEPSPYQSKTEKLDWVIVGGESGTKARPMHPDWARGLRDQCKAAGTPFFFKQWGEWKHGSDFANDAKVILFDGSIVNIPETAEDAARACMMRRVGKRAAGCLLDGVEHKEMPEWLAIEKGLV